METPRDSQPLPQSEPNVEEGNAVEEWHELQEDEYNVHALKDLIIAKEEDPDPSLLHAIAAIFENAITRYMDDTDHGRSTQNVECLCGLIWEDEKFSVLLPSFLQNADSVSVKVAAARLFSNFSPLMQQDILKDDALDKTRSWVRNEIPRLLADDCYLMHETGRRQDLDSEMMCTYYIGLLAANLARGDDRLEKKVLRYNLPTKLMLYLSDETSIRAEDITDLVKQVGRAAGSEAKAANALALSVRVDAAEVVKTAAFEEYRKTNYKEKYAELRLAKLRFCIQCLVVMKKHVEVLDLLLCEDGFDIIHVLLEKSSNNEKASSTILLLPDVLKLIRELVVNKKYAKLFVEGGGLERLLAIKRSDLTFVDLSFCLLRFGSPKIMESICALPSNVVDQFVELAIQLLNCQQDQSRSNAALFFGYHHAFRPPVMDAFDKQYGLRSFLRILHYASERSGVTPGQLNNPGSLPNDQSPLQVLTSFEKKIAAEACTALEQYFIAKFLLVADSLSPSVGAGIVPVDLIPDTMDAVLRYIQKNPDFGLVFQRNLWPAVERFLGSHVHITLLELYQASAAEQYWSEMPVNVLQVLSIATLVSCSHSIIVNATSGNGQTCVALILDAADVAGYGKGEVTVLALKVLANLVSLPSMSDEISGTTQSEVGQVIRANHGLAVLLRLLQPKELEGGHISEWIWALSCRVLLSVARDDKIADSLRKMQLEEKLLKVVKDSGRHAPGCSTQWRLPEVDRETKELLRVLTVSGQATTLAATSEDQSELLLLTHNYLQKIGLVETAASLLRESGLRPLPCDTPEVTGDYLFERYMKTRTKR